MSFERRSLRSAGCSLVCLALAMLVCLALSLLFGCKTRYITQDVPVVVHERDSIYKVQQFHTHDTLIMRDSVMTYIKGDTVHLEKWHMMQAINHVARVDTVYKDRNVEVPVTVTQTEVREVNKLHWWQHALMWMGGALLAFFGWKIIKRRFLP